MLRTIWFDNAIINTIFFRTNWHANVEKEYDLVMNSAGIVDLTPFAKFTVEGPQAYEYLDYITANRFVVTLKWNENIYELLYALIYLHDYQS